MKDFFGDTDRDEGTIEPKAAYVTKKGDKWMSGDIVREVRPVPPDCTLIGKDAYYFQGIEGELVGLSLARIEEDRKARDEKLIDLLFADIVSGFYPTDREALMKTIRKVFAEVDK